MSGDANVLLSFRSPTGRVVHLDAVADLYCQREPDRLVD
jgi:hypothetical protein